MAEIPNFEMAILQAYQKKGLPARLSLVLFFLSKISTNYTNPAKDPKQETYGTNANEKMAILQLGAISQLMILLEDVALFCYVFLQDKPFDYYQFLDKKGEDDLGAIIGNFYKNTENLTFNEIRKIMSYGKSNDFDFLNDDDRKILEIAIKNGVSWGHYFLNKLSVFYDSHIAIFRRIKHASFPIQIGLEIPKDDEWHSKFDFWSLGFTSKELKDTASILPFSKMAANSYTNLVEDIHLCFTNILNSRLLMVQRGVNGILPYGDDNFSSKLSDETRNSLTEFWKRFEQNHPSKFPKWEGQIAMQGKYSPWYKYLDDYYSKPLFDMIDDNRLKK